MSLKSKVQSPRSKVQRPRSKVQSPGRRHLINARLNCGALTSRRYKVPC